MSRWCGSRDRNTELVLGRTYAWDPAVRERLVALGQGGEARSLDEIGTLDVQIAEAFAAATLQLLAEAGTAPAQVRAIGSHGQTVRHRPEGARFNGQHPFTWQLGDGNLIAERTRHCHGRRLPSPRRRRRRPRRAAAAGAARALLHGADEDRAVLNLGGIANFTLLPAAATVRGFDTGPANCLLDAWCQRHTGQPYDGGGAFAAQGQLDADLLARLLDDPWFIAAAAEEHRPRALPSRLAAVPAGRH